MKAWIKYWWHRLKLRLAQAAGIVLFSLLIGLVTAYVSFKPDLESYGDPWKSQRQSAVTFLDANGEVIGSRGGLHTKRLRLDEIPEHLKLAFLITEDRRFYEHGPIDWWGIARAMVVNITKGKFVQGGSTITQQLAKNLFLTRERTLVRKVKEVILARQLEERYSKDEILELYLNRIYLGAGAYGVEAAAQTYFDKSARDVTLAEAAMLAGLAKAPSRLAPTNNLELAQERSRVVLGLLRKTKTISEEDYARAYAFPATVTAKYTSGDDNYFLDFVNSRVNDLVSIKDVDVVVTTTLNSDLQVLAENAVKAVLDKESERRRVEQAALVALARDGAVRAMVGGRSYVESQFNRAVQARRQPGSAFKPFVYLTALERGMTPESIYYDEPVRVGDWTPRNYTGVYRGRVTLLQALQHSINTVAVRVTQEVGADNIIETAHRLGIKSPLASNRSLALGTSEVTLWELTGAYLPFANQGLSAEPYAIKTIETRDGTVLYRHRKHNPQRLFRRDLATQMTHMMYQVIYDGTGRRAKIEGHPAAGKTGTSQDWRDAWFLGYTGHLVTGVWVGNDDSTPMNKVTGGGVPAEIWQTFMAAAHKDWPPIALPGAYPARDPIADQRLREFLNNLSQQFARVKNKRARKKLFGIF